MQVYASYAPAHHKPGRIHETYPMQLPIHTTSQRNGRFNRT